MSFLADIKNLLITAALCLAIGFGAGFYTKGQFFAAKETKRLQADKVQSAKNVVESVQVSQAVQNKVDAKVAVVDKVKTEAAIRIIKQQERTNEQFARELAIRAEKGTTVGLACPAPDLDLGTVRLLNAARQGSPVGAASSGDAALEAPSGIGVGRLVDNDLDVVKMYHDLATRHDALVDSVEQELRRQAGQK